MLIKTHYHEPTEAIYLSIITQGLLNAYDVSSASGGDIDVALHAVGHLEPHAFNTYIGRTDLPYYQDVAILVARLLQIGTQETDLLQTCCWENQRVEGAKDAALAEINLLSRRVAYFTCADVFLAVVSKGCPDHVYTPCRFASKALSAFQIGAELGAKDLDSDRSPFSMPERFHPIIPKLLPFDPEPSPFDKPEKVDSQWKLFQLMRRRYDIWDFYVRQSGFWRQVLALCSDSQPNASETWSDSSLASGFDIRRFETALRQKLLNVKLGKALRATESRREDIKCLYDNGARLSKEESCDELMHMIAEDHVTREDWWRLRWLELLGAEFRYNHPMRKEAVVALKWFRSPVESLEHSRNVSKVPRVCITFFTAFSFIGVWQDKLPELDYKSEQMSDHPICIESHGQCVLLPLRLASRSPVLLKTRRIKEECYKDFVRFLLTHPDDFGEISQELQETLHVYEVDGRQRSVSSHPNK